MKLIDLPDLEQVNTPDGRFYKTPSGVLYPSVTTVLGVEPKPEIDRWRKSIGEAEADRVTERACVRGTLVHKMCEDHLMGKEVKPPNVYDEMTYKSLLPHLEKVSKVYSIEGRLYSDKLKSAGSVDLVAEYDGYSSVVDWKTSTRLKHKEEIHSYFKQTAAYSYMFWERTGIVVSRLVIVMAVDFDKAKVYIESPKTWLPEYIKARKKFQEIRGF